ncbi:MAG: hypothetical protein JWP69_1573 [Flaviaesturariibacter sp.]|nr:hypothetical protein [Flaviaesturariibacter sp.]
MHPQLTIYNQSVRSFIHIDFGIEKLDATCAFAEGPVWNAEGFYLFSDIPRNAIFKIAPGYPKEVYLEHSGFTGSNKSFLSEQIGSNGLAYDSGGALFICQHGDGAVAKYADGTVQPLLTGINNKPFNSPNDLVVHNDGTFYFSDPPYGLKEAKLNPELRQEKAAYYAWRDGELTAFSSAYSHPNGICLSPDQKSVFTCSNKPFERFILEFDAQTLEQKRIVAEENSDGIKCDPWGNLYLCTKEGILILNKEGERLARMELDTVPANCCWGGKDGNDLFITARENLFLIPGLLKA